MVSTSVPTRYNSVFAWGFKPDSCFYLAHVETVRGQRRIDLATDPPPDLGLGVENAATGL